MSYGRSRGSGLLRFLWTVSVFALLIGLGGGVLLVASGRPPSVPELSFSSGIGPGVMLLQPADQPGPDPFTAPVAVDLDLDLALVALAPATPDDLLVPHRRGSQADRLAAGAFGFELLRRRDEGQALRVGTLQAIAAETLGSAGVLEDLDDLDGDGLDDTRSFTILAADGSAVCATIGFVRTLAMAQGLSVDPEDGAAVTGYSWDPRGPCLPSNDRAATSQVVTGATPGLYGTSPVGEVCDLGELVTGLRATPQLAEAWATVQGIEVPQLDDFIGGLTPVVLMHDTVVTDFGWRNGEIVPRQAVLQRGTAVLVSPRGLPVARCMSGAPLRPPQALPAAPSYLGQPWEGFDGDDVAEVLPAERNVVAFVLLDIDSGKPIDRAPGSSDARASLAGPLVPGSP